GGGLGLETARDPTKPHPWPTAELLRVRSPIPRTSRLACPRAECSLDPTPRGSDLHAGRDIDHRADFLHAGSPARVAPSPAGSWLDPPRRTAAHLAGVRVRRR